MPRKNENTPANTFGGIFAKWNKSQETPFTVCEIARKVGYSRQAISSKLRNETPMTVEEAVLVCKLTNAPMQALFKEAASEVVVNEKCKRGELVRGRKKAQA